MKKLILTLLAAAQLSGISFAQESAKTLTIASNVPAFQAETLVKDPLKLPQKANSSSSPYKTRFGIDGPITGALVATNVAGLYLIQKNKDGPSDAELARIDADIQAARNEVNSFDRFGAGYYNPNARTASDFLFYPSFTLPFLLLMDNDVSQNKGQIAGMYIQTMAVTGALFTMTVANVERKRPLVYNNEPGNDQRGKKHAQNSFFAGHTAAAASATFFAAKVFHDFNPDSGARPFVWGAAAAIPATIGYLRLRAGKHFLSDNLLGYFIGAGAGILVPQLHKKGLEGVSVVPVMGPYNGMAASVTF